MQAINGYVENGQFYPLGQEIKVLGRKRAIITILDEPVSNLTTSDTNDLEQRKAWLARLKELGAISKGEEVLEIPKRSKEMKPPISLMD